MPESHLPFAVINNTLNRVMRPLLRSRWHGRVSDRLLLITVTGRRSGRTFTFPVSYTEREGVVTIVPSSPERKRWWRNLRGGAPVTLRLRGVDRTGHAVARGDERTGVTVEVRLD
jgi:hypothetical protein